MSLVRILLGLVSLAAFSSPAGATMLWKGGGSGVVANTCSAGDFFSAVDGSGNFTCATPSGSGDVTAVGDCASGSCFTGGADGGNSIQFEGSGADGFETTLTAANPGADYTVTLPAETGTVCTTGSVCSGYQSELPVVNVTDFGALCDGANDDTAEIIAALDSVTNRRGRFVFPAGNCLITDELIWAEVATSGPAGGVVIEGVANDRSRISYSGTGYALAFADNFVASSDVHGVVIRDISIQAKQSTGALGAVLLSGVEYPLLENVRLFSDTFTGPFSALTVRNTLFGTFQNLEFDSADTAITIAGINSSSNLFSSLQLQDDIGIDSTAAFSAAELCWATDEPYDCCTGAGTGTGTDFRLCGADSQGGHNNTFVNVNCRISETDQCAVFGANSDFNTLIGWRDVKAGGGARTSGIDFGSEEQIAIGLEADTDPVNTAATSFIGSAYTGNDSTRDPDVVGSNELTAPPNTSMVVGSDSNVFVNVDQENDSTGSAFVVANGNTGGSGTQIFSVSEAGQVNFFIGTDPRLYETDNTNYVQLSAPTLAADWTFTWPADDGDANDVLCDPAGDGVSDWCAISDAMVPNSITVDLATLATTATTANAGDSATSFFSSGELERTLLPAASADCAASNWAKGVDADFVLDCAQPAFTDISGSVTDAQVPNTITVDLATLATTATTANAGDSATAFFSSGELERTLLPAASADCSANQYAKGVDADFVLDCAQPDHGNLAGLSDDDHAQYALLAGRSGGQTLIGGTASGNDLTLQSTSNATRGSIFFGSEWEWLDQIPDAADGTTYSGGLWNPTLSITGAAGTTSYVFGLDLNPTVNLNDAAGVAISFMGAMRARGTFTRSGAATYVPAFYLLFADAVNTSATDGLGPMGTALIYDNLLNSYTSTGSTTATLGRASTVWSNHIIQTNGDASTRLDVGSDYGFYWTTHLSETTGILNVTNVIGAKFETPALGGTTPQITTIAAVDIDKMTGATTDAGNIGIRNKSTTVFAPTTTQAIAAVGNTITCDETYKKFTTFTGTNALTSNPSITDGATGQICILQNVDATATDCITLTDSTLGMQLAGNDTLCPNDTITLVYDGTDWVETARSNN